MASASHFLGRLYKEGEVIYSQGDTGDCMYIVHSGQVEILRRERSAEYCLAVFNAGDFFGEMALFGYPIRTATARAVAGASVLSLEKKSFLRRLQHDPSLAFTMLKKMADRIQHLEKELVQYGEASLPPELR